MLVVVLLLLSFHNSGINLNLRCLSVTVHVNSASVHLAASNVGISKGSNDHVSANVPSGNKVSKTNSLWMPIWRCKWMKEVLNGHHIRCVNAFRMDSDLFKQLCEDLYSKYGLQSTRNMSYVEKVGIFIYTLAMGASNRDVGERFQRSGETISRAFHEVLEAISDRNSRYKGLARDIIKPDDPTFQSIPSYITNDARYMPYFKDCIGCIDGTHIAACIPEVDQLRYRGRKGIPTFNVMAACNFDMCFTFISVGWEGSAHDTRVFLHAINTPSMNFPKPPQGRYYLVDKGYPDKQGYLVPYPRIRYHQSQFEHEPPTNAQEAFNRAHSSLRSCIERSFGVLKKRWKILANMPQFSVETQIDVIMATFALHNYIRKNSQDDMMFNVFEQHPDYIPPDELQDSSSNISINENLSQASTEMKEIRN
ncbi:PREDICTED: putative nuclease HARBI1, partial [Ipomoea nil]|uniref:putative nuclease HARBI1 n=1 Tax=Ipomoea nil TaxID=35883 RepID=UPI000901D20C